MTAIADYFVRHYTLVLDNDQSSYNEIRQLVKNVLRNSGVTVSQYIAMSESDRAAEWADEIGTAVLGSISEAIGEAIGDNEGSIGAMLINEVMLVSEGEVSWALGKHYFPEDGEAGDFLTADDDDSSEVPDDFPVRVLISRQEADAAGDPMTCGVCGRTWDDSIATGLTPVPAGRCPFESFHE